MVYFVTFSFRNVLVSSLKSPVETKRSFVNSVGTLGNSIMNSALPRKL